MKLKGMVSILLVGMLMLSLLVACGRTEGDVKSADTKLRIGFMNTNLSNEYQVAMLDAARIKAKDMGIELIEQDGQGDATKQISQMEALIGQKVNAVIMAPYDKDACAPAVDKCVNAGIPLIVLNSTVSNMDKAQAYVGSDDKIAGVIAMTELSRVLGDKGNVIMIRGPIGNSAEVNRTKGIEEVLSENKDLKLIGDQTAEWDREKALKLMENKLQSDEKIDGVVAQNDEMAIGAAKAIIAAGKGSEIKVIGIDAIPDALKAVEEGVLIGTVFQDAKGQAELALDVAARAVAGEKVDYENFVEFKLVTKDNVNNFK